MKKGKNKTKKVQKVPQAKLVGAVDISKHLSMLVLDRNLSVLVPEAEAYQEYLKNHIQPEEETSPVSTDKISLDDVGTDDKGESISGKPVMADDPSAYFLPLQRDFAETDIKKEKSAYFNLAQKKSWQEIVDKSESELPELKGKSAIEARLWWVKAQKELAIMPTGILAAPLEEVGDDVILRRAELPLELLALAEKILLEIGQDLLDSDDMDMGNLFLSKAYDINSDNIKIYLDGLNKELNYLEQQAQIPPTKKKIAKIKETIKPLQNIIKDSDKRNEDILSEHVLSQVIHQKAASVKNKSSWTGFISIFLLLLAVFMGREFIEFFDGKFDKMLTGDANEESEFFQEDVKEVSFDIPELALISPAPISPDRYNPVFSNLLEQLDGGAKNDNKKGDQEGTTAEYTIPPAAEQGNVEYVNTAGPVEPPDIAAIMEKEYTIPTAAAAVAEEDDIDRVYKPVVGGFSRNDAIVPAYMIPLKKGSEQGTMYLIKEYATVYQYPRENAPAVANLVTGDKINVIKIKNGWAEINSQQGRPGYIKAGALGNKSVNLEDIPKKFDQGQK